MNVTGSFTVREATTIRSWYTYATDESMHYGGGSVVFPTEIMLLSKIDRSGEREQTFTPSEIDLLADWMRKSIRGKYGSATHLCEFEAALYHKINSFLSSATQ